jgi:hypothetical protein
MLKNLKSTLIINGIGFALLMFCLYGYQGARVPSVKHASIAIDEKVLKERLSRCSNEELKKMLAAGEEIEEWDGILQKTGLSVIQKVLQGQNIVLTMEHYPLNDTFDNKTYSQYYYHAHREKEHGHFHLFLRQGGMEEGTLPLLWDKQLDDIQTFAHLVAISMDDEGYPLTLFTVNRWVTGESWYAPEDLKKMVDRFDVSHAHPSYVANRWLKAMLILFRPQIDDLIDERDQILMRWQRGIPLKDVLENRELDVISEEKISIEAQLKVIRDLLS